MSLSHTAKRNKHKSADNCPNVDTHTPAPSDYVGRLEWMDEMRSTHKQKACRTCGFYVMWEKKQ